MLCDICHKNQATVHLTEIYAGKVRELHLCQECAAKQAEIIQKQFSISDFLAGLADFGGIERRENSSGLICPNCGMSYEEFKKVGKFGCENCYKVFRDHIIYLLRKLHGSTQHKGKYPKFKGGISLEGQIEELKKYLDRAVSLEEYEEAARIRDNIRRLEKKLREKKSRDGKEGGKNAG